jgi:hypothetical protein
MFLTMSVHVADAQILDRSRHDQPRTWISGSLGLVGSGALDGDASGSRWNFSNAAQVRACLEYSLVRGNSFGVSVAYAEVPMTNVPFSGSREDATERVAAVALTFHGGGGVALHQVCEASIGALRFSDFTSDVDGRNLEPLDADFDVTFMIGGGFGYSIGTRTQIVLVRDFGIVLHQGSGLPSDANTTAYHRTTRLGLRYGVGTASP